MTSGSARSQPAAGAVELPFVGRVQGLGLGLLLGRQDGVQFRMQGTGF